MEKELKPKMEVPVEKMEAILGRLEALEAASKEKDKEIAALSQSVSKTKLDEAKANLDLDKRKRVHFKKLDGKVVIGWPESLGPEKKSEIIFNPNTNSPVGEILKSVYYFVDGTKSELIDQIKFFRSTEAEFARVVEDQGDYGVLEFENKDVLATPIKVHKKYWNA